MATKATLILCYNSQNMKYLLLCPAQHFQWRVFVGSHVLHVLYIPFSLACETLVCQHAALDIQLTVSWHYTADDGSTYYELTV